MSTSTPEHDDSSALSRNVVSDYIIGKFLWSLSGESLFVALDEDYLPVQNQRRHEEPLVWHWKHALAKHLGESVAPTWRWFDIILEESSSVEDAMELIQPDSVVLDFEHREYRAVLIHPPELTVAEANALIEDDVKLLSLMRSADVGDKRRALRTLEQNKQGAPHSGTASLYPGWLGDEFWMQTYVEIMFDQHMAEAEGRSRSERCPRGFLLDEKSEMSAALVDDSFGPGYHRCSGFFGHLLGRVHRPGAPPVFFGRRAFVEDVRRGEGLTDAQARAYLIHVIKTTAGIDPYFQPANLIDLVREVKMRLGLENEHHDTISMRNLESVGRGWNWGPAMGDLRPCSTLGRTPSVADFVSRNPPSDTGLRCEVCRYMEWREQQKSALRKLADLVWLKSLQLGEKLVHMFTGLARVG